MQSDVLPVTDTSKPSSSGITLVLPSLSALKQNGVKSKRKSGTRQTFPDEVKKPPRPMKLKPLKEVLLKLITQIKKKDDYAFFLSPVNPTRVAGYSDIIKRPMDFGTMTSKVTRGRYRSLEEFTSDLRLVMSNTKLFNPPGSIYHTEAERIETWALEHIAKAAPTVIEYETDWNIDIEQDFDDMLDSQGVQMDNDREESHRIGTPVDKERSPSVASTQLQPGLGRRVARIVQQQQQPQQQKKSTNAKTISESVEPDGHLPGFKDGVGVFPAGSDWAELMLALKLKGKKYRTKKERIRIEKGGPPYSADGSLDYTQLEDPFSFLSAFVPDPQTRPRLIPLYPVDPSRPFLLAPSTLPLEGRPPPILSTTTQDKDKQHRNKRRHWTVARGAPTRTKIKDREDDDPGNTIIPAREAQPVDWGLLAPLSAALHAEMAARARTRTGVMTDEEEEEAVQEAIRDGLRQASISASDVTDSAIVNGDTTAGYWTSARAIDAETYVREVVYGGVDGYAYVRSLAEFVSDDARGDQTADDTNRSGLGRPLAQWVERHIVDPLTGGLHALLRETVHQLRSQASIAMSASSPSQVDGIHDQISLSLQKYPIAMGQLMSLRQIMTHQIDMGALIFEPTELFGSEEVWAGREWKRRKMEEVRASRESADVGGNDVKNVEDGKGDGHDVKGINYEGPEMLQYVMDHTASTITTLSRRLRSSCSVVEPLRTLKRRREEDETENGDGQSEHGDGGGTVVKDEQRETITDTDEDTALRNLRLNLLALAKRAPLDKIARLPADLVPEHIRLYVPTLG